MIYWYLSVTAYFQFRVLGGMDYIFTSRRPWATPVSPFKLQRIPETSFCISRSRAESLLMHRRPIRVQCRCSISGASRVIDKMSMVISCKSEATGCTRQKSSHTGRVVSESELRVQRLHRPLWTIQPSAQFSHRVHALWHQGEPAKQLRTARRCVSTLRASARGQKWKPSGNNPSPCFVSALSVHAAWRAHHWMTDSFVQFSLGVDTQDHRQRLRHH